MGKDKTYAEKQVAAKKNFRNTIAAKHNTRDVEVGDKAGLAAARAIRKQNFAAAKEAKLAAKHRDYVSFKASKAAAAAAANDNIVGDTDETPDEGSNLRNKRPAKDIYNGNFNKNKGGMNQKTAAIIRHHANNRNTRSQGSLGHRT